MITEQNFTVERLQPRNGNRHAVFFAHARETLTYHYERNPADPRIQHALTLEVDDFGNVLKSAAIGYGRRKIIRVVDSHGGVTEVPNPGLNALDPQDQEKQTQLLITYTEKRFTNAIDTADDHRTPLPAEKRTYELTGYAPTGPASRFQPSDFVEPDPVDPQHLIQGFDSEIQYEQQPTTGKQRRLIEQARTLYRKDDLTVFLPLGGLEPLALPGEGYKLAFTPGLLTQVFDRNGQALLPNPADVLGGQGGDSGGYVDLDDDGHWWIPSGLVFLSPNGGDAATQELAFARQHFFLQHRYRDAFHTSAVSTEDIVTYDDHNLLMVETRDPFGNVVTVETQDDRGNAAIGNDYRVLQPYWVTDPNGNRTEVAFDALGLVVATAVMGKPGEDKGDRLDSFKADLSQADLHNFHDAADPHTLASDLLQGASTRILYDLHRFRISQQVHPDDPSQWEAPYAATLARETHVSDPLPPRGLKIQISFSYSDSFGREIQKKIQAESGPGPTRDANGKIIIGADGLPVMTPNDVTPRWVGNGWTIFNNKGKPVRQYEPFFTDTHRFEFDVRIGASPVLFYDPVERVVATLHPNHAYEKVVFAPWLQESWDVNDTVLHNPKTDDDVNAFVLRLPDVEYSPTWFEQRASGTLGAQEQNAANKASVHAQTPSFAHADSLGRTFLTVAHNRYKYSTSPPADPPVEEFYPTRILFDIKGNQLAVVDAKDRTVMRYDYDMLSNRAHQASMEAGERWMLNDVAVKPLYAWDSRNHQFRTAYDPLRRPKESYLREGTGPELTVGRTVYGDSQPNPEAKNQRGKVVQVLDQAGLVISDDYDFKGNLLSSQRQLTSEYKTTLDWSADQQVEAETFTTRTTYDALNRPITVVTPDRSVYHPTFNEANLLEKVDVGLSGAATTPFVTNIDYDAKGQRRLIDYRNNIKTEYGYERLTFRLSNIKTTRATDQALMQDLNYTYDPAGNITHIQDGAQETIYFNNQVVSPYNDYTYDAIYRLINAEGREHPGQLAQPQNSWDDRFRTHLPHPGDGQVMRRYAEEYDYDQVGNFLRLFHQTADGNWTRSYVYNETSLLEPPNKSNRLSGSTVGGNNPVTEAYFYDPHGNMTSMPHLSVMQWDFRDHLQATSQQVVSAGTPETTYYRYDATGQRVRKVTENQNGTRTEERIYLGGYEVYHRFDNDGSTVKLERETLHVKDDKQRIALVETRTQGDEPGVPQQLIRYQFSNHLGSASLELDDRAQIISYEEYYPYGSTSYQAGPSAIEVKLKRYRYTGMERDEESGLGYHLARYYAAWLGRWCSADPIGIEGGEDLYEYSNCRPVNLLDTHGQEPKYVMKEDKGVYFITLPLDSIPYVVQRTSSETFTEAAVKTDTPSATEVVINAELYGGEYPLNNSPSDPTTNPAQGLVIQNKIALPGSKESPETFFFSNDLKGHWQFGKGNPSRDSQIAFGGGIPVIIDSLPYGIQNKYKAGAPSNLPVTGDPGPGNEKWLEYRSNKGFEEMFRQKHFKVANEKGGLTVMGIDRETNRLLIIVKPQGSTESWRITDIRDFLVKEGVEDALAWDGSSSSTLVLDSKILSDPADKKNKTIPFGIGFRVSEQIVPVKSDAARLHDCLDLHAGSYACVPGSPLLP
jgi:RHS repeat-associated protein